MYLPLVVAAPDCGSADIMAWWTPPSTHVIIGWRLIQLMKLRTITW
jgi:hypothetical protein